MKTASPYDASIQRLRHLAPDRHCTVKPQSDDGSGQPEAAAIDGELGITNVGNVLDHILEQLVEATQHLVKLHPIIEEDKTAVAKVLCCVSLALGGVNLLVPRLPEP